jgi:LysM repeat protein
MKKTKQIFTPLANSEIRYVHSLIYRNFSVVIVITLALLVGSAAIAAEKIPSGTIKIDETQLGFIIGGDIGKGTLNYQGVDYSFKTGGIKVGGMGIAKISAVGEVYDLFDISQFPGTYVTGDYGIALGGGVGGMVLKNQNDVFLRLQSTMQGIDLNVGLEGLDIKLEGVAEEQPPAEEPAPQVEMQQQAGQTYTVQSGDTLYEIASRFGTTVSALKSANNLTSDMIRVGQVLNIP